MRTIQVPEMIDEQKFNRFHLQILLCCIFIIICDGYDMFMLGTILPSLMAEWRITAVEAGLFSSYALFGMMIGALVFGPLADKFGRKKVILICTVIFSVFTFTSGFADEPTSFGIQRFVAGLGLGGVMPNLIAIITEYAPKKLRSTLVAIMFSGHALGGVVASMGAMYLIPNFDWRAVVWLGALPLIFMPILYKLLPESINYLMTKNKKSKLVDVLNQVNVDGQYTMNDNYVLQEQLKSEMKGFPVKELFKKGRTLSTLMFWIAFFMCLFVMYGLSTWLPKIMGGAGYELGSSLTFLVVLNLGAVFGAIVGGKLADRYGSKRILVTFLVIGFITLTMLSFKPSMIMLYILIAIAGGTTTGTQIVTNAYVSQYYPNEIRSTGVGWALGIGRIGGILAPTFCGILLDMKLSLQVNFLAFAIPCIIAAAAIWFIQDNFSNLTAIRQEKKLI
ncbi:aromatic acid/H+ symport family MFS transporter [Peribacillus simplex]|uniref:MFS transporter n=1 Tax=Peribacillus simplex TaxID=1478 RepID=UPI0011A1D000|nr:aromatic acid/H+ symport family MFS transporter [Peribacillus simplex]